MIGLRIKSSRMLQKEAVKLFVQTKKLHTTSSNVMFWKYSNGNTHAYGFKQENYKLIQARPFDVVQWNSMLVRPYTVSAPYLKESEDYRSENNITVSGKDVPDPIQSIDEEAFPEYILRYLKRQNIDKPTIIQAQGWPIALSGKNLVGIAQTGTGKTLAYLLPAVMHIKEKSTRKGSSPVVLVLAPTRELARQIEQVANGLARMLDMRTVCVYGGASRGRQSEELNRGVDILIATPGRLIDFLNTNQTNLNRCTYLVLDEADRMLDMGFEPQIREIADAVPLERQILMWSATWPREVQALAHDYLGEYVQVNVGSTDLSANHNITQVVHVCEEKDKDNKLVELLQEIVDADSGKILIFANMKKTVENVVYRLRLKGWPAVGIHGDKTQLQRDSIIFQFKRGRAKIMVASDVAARGLDVDGISYVINYDYPMTSEDYIHRIGRTARKGATGTSHTLITPENARQAEELINILKEAKQDVPLELELLSKQRTEAKQASKKRQSFNGKYSSSWGSKRFGRNGFWNNHSDGSSRRPNRNRGWGDE